MSVKQSSWAPMDAPPQVAGKPPLEWQTAGPTSTVLPGSGLPVANGPDRWRRDLPAAVAVVVACVLLGAPAGLLWSAVAPRLTVRLTEAGPQADNLESTKAFIGADGSFLLVVLALGVVTGLMAWFFARKHGPWTVVGLLLGGLLAAQIAATVGLRPGAAEAAARVDNPASRGTVELYLGKRDGPALTPTRTKPTAPDLHLRAPWTVVGWPVGALLVFIGLGLRRPEEFD